MVVFVIVTAHSIYILDSTRGTQISCRKSIYVDAIRKYLSIDICLSSYDMYHHVPYPYYIHTSNDFIAVLYCIIKSSVGVPNTGCYSNKVSQWVAQVAFHFTKKISFLGNKMKYSGGIFAYSVLCRNFICVYIHHIIQNEGEALCAPVKCSWTRLHLVGNGYCLSCRWRSPVLWKWSVSGHFVAVSLYMCERNIRFMDPASLPLFLT